MGKRLHVAVKYEVDYSSSASFNWHNVEFKTLLNDLNVNTYDDEAEFTDGFGDNWECETKEFDNAFEFLKNHKEDILNYENDKTFKVNGDDINQESVYDSIMALEYGDTFDENYDEVISMMGYWQKQRAKGSYMHFSAF